MTLTVSIIEAGEHGVLPGYLRVREGQVSETVDLCDGLAAADYDARGQLLGIEFLGACEVQVTDPQTK